MINSFPPLVNEQSETLILGSIPGVPSLKKTEYYGNKNNAFWSIMFKIHNEKFSPAYSDKIKLLRKHKIALWDTIKTCERTGSADSNIKNPVANNIKKLIKKYPKITKIVFNGKTAEKYFKKYVGEIEGIETRVMPSTSPANARMNFEEKLQKWQLIK